MLKAEEERRRTVLQRKYVWEDLFAMDANNDGTIDIHEFSIYLLKLWGMVDDEVLEAINTRFRELDTDGSGTYTHTHTHRHPRPPPPLSHQHTHTHTHAHTHTHTGALTKEDFLEVMCEEPKRGMMLRKLSQSTRHMKIPTDEEDEEEEEEEGDEGPAPALGMI
jgi:Ca2+-binding EF-hand superfamily protein